MFNDGRWLHIFHCRDKETGCILHEDLCIITVELPVWQKLSIDESESILEPLGKWLRHAYDMRENHERIVQSYIHTGFLDGIQKERCDMARKLKAAGLPLEQIVGLTGLDAGEVDSL